MRVIPVYLYDIQTCDNGIHILRWILFTDRVCIHTHTHTLYIIYICTVVKSLPLRSWIYDVSYCTYVYITIILCTCCCGGSGPSGDSALWLHSRVFYQWKTKVVFIGLKYNILRPKNRMNDECIIIYYDVSNTVELAKWGKYRCNEIRSFEIGVL